MDQGVLIVDPQPFFCDALAGALRGRGLDPVMWTTDELEAQRIAEQTDPGVVLTELELAEGSGLGLARRLLDRHRVVVLSRRSEGDILFDVVTAGAEGCLSHETGVDHLVSLLRSQSEHQFIVDASRLGDALRRAVTLHVRGGADESRLARLTPREREILQLLARGLDNEEIGAHLYLSPHTVRTHIGKSLKKLGVHSRAEAVRVVMRAGGTGQGVEVLQIWGPELGRP